MVLVDPFDQIATGYAEALEVGSLLRLLAASLDSLGATYGLDGFLKRSIEDARRVALIADERLEISLEKIGAGEVTLHEARVPGQFQRAA
jgi:hypothetical protein